MNLKGLFVNKFNMGVIILLVLIFSVSCTKLESTSLEGTSGGSGSDLTAPLAPTIISPLNGSTLNLASITLTGQCETGATVNISGNINNSPITAACISSVYSSTLTLSPSNGSKTINVTQTDASNNVSVSRGLNLTLNILSPVTGDYPIPANCDVPPSFTNSNKFYVDPVNGNMNNDGSSANPWRTLAEVLSSNKIESRSYAKPYVVGSQPTQIKNAGAPVKAGDAIYLRNGNHGTVMIQDYSNLEFIAVRAQAGHNPRLERLYVTAASNFVFEGLTVTPNTLSAGGTIVEISDHNFHGPASNIVIAKNTVYSTLSSSAYSAANWLNAASGIMSYSPCTTIVENNITNVRFGGGVLNVDSIMDSNLVQNFSGDGLRINASRTTLINNTIMDSRLEDSDGDDNHDDGIQSFNLGSDPFYDMTIEANTIIESTNPNNTFKSGMQGIGIFDGVYDRLKVLNNVVSVTFYQDIGILGTRNSIIANNTVVGHPQSWCGLFDSKTGAAPVNSTFKNNIGYIIIAPASGSSNNITVTNPNDHFVTFDNVNKVYDFHLKSTSTAKTAGVPLQTVLKDIEGKVRSTTTPSVGAYEY